MNFTLPLIFQPDRAEKVFTLLFSFTRDDACRDEEIKGFDSTVREVLGSALVPEETYARLRTIYEQTMRGPEIFTESLAEVAREFEEDREVLLLLVRIMLRLSLDDGMVLQRDKNRMQQVLREFSFDVMELDCLEHEEREQLYYFVAEETKECGADDNLSAHYQILGCAPGASDREVQRNYRRLVMQHHPDRQAALKHPEKSHASHQFRRIQAAYETIRRSRKQA